MLFFICFIPSKTKSLFVRNCLCKSTTSFNIKLMCFFFLVRCCIVRNPNSKIKTQETWKINIVAWNICFFIENTNKWRICIEKSAVPISAVPISAVTISAVTISAVTISAVTISAVPISAVPISAVPISAVPISAVSISAVPISAVSISAVTISAVSISAVTTVIFV